MGKEEENELRYTEKEYQAAIKAMGDAMGALIAGVNNAVFFANQAIGSLLPLREIIMDSYRDWMKDQGIDFDENIEDKDLVQQLFGSLNAKGDDDDSFVM